MVVNAPPPQALALLEAFPEPLRDTLAGVEMGPCWALALVFPRPLSLDFDAAFVNASPIGWIARNGANPGRAPTPETWIIHAAETWSREHLETPTDDLGAWLRRTLLVAGEQHGRRALVLAVSLDEVLREDCCGDRSDLCPIGSDLHLRGIEPEQPFFANSSRTFWDER